MEGRQYFRLRKELPLVWGVAEQGVEGQGSITDISLTGMQFKTDKPFSPQHGLVMAFKSDQIPSLPNHGKLVWFRKRQSNNTTIYTCGVKFEREDGFHPAWRQWMEENILKLADAADNSILRRYLEFDT